MEKNRGERSFKERGAIFTLDVTMAILIVILFIATSAFYIAKTGEQTLTDLRTLKVGSDVVAYLDNSKTIHTLRVDLILQNITLVLPQTHSIKLDIKCDNQTPGATLYSRSIPNIPIPETGFVGSGKRYFIIRAGEYNKYNSPPEPPLPLDNILYCKVQHFIWIKR